MSGNPAAYPAASSRPSPKSILEASCTAGLGAKISTYAWPSTICSHCLHVIAPRASPAGQRGLPIGWSGSSLPWRTAIPTRAWVIDFAIDQEMSRIFGPNPSRYRSATRRPRCTSTTARVSPRKLSTRSTASRSRVRAAASTPEESGPGGHCCVGHATPAGCAGQHSGGGCSATMGSPDQRQLLFPILSDAVARSCPDQEGLGGRDGRTSEEADGGVEQARQARHGGRPRRDGSEDCCQVPRRWEISLGAEAATLVAYAGGSFRGGLASDRGQVG